MKNLRLDIISKSGYFKKVVEEFKILEAKIVNTHLGHLVKLLIMKYPQIKYEKKMMESTPNASWFETLCMV